MNTSQPYQMSELRARILINSGVIEITRGFGRDISPECTEPGLDTMRVLGIAAQ